MKKIFSLLLVMLIGFSLTACGEDITLTIENIDITIIEGNEHTITFSTNDDKTPVFASSNEAVLTVDSLGVVTAVSEGDAVITVTSKGDSSLVIEVNFDVRKLITLITSDSSIDLYEGDTHEVVISSNDEYTYSSSNTDIFVVDEDGIITAKSEGSADLVVTSTYDESYEISISINVTKVIEISVTDVNHVMVIGDSKVLSVESNDDVIFESRNPNIATIDQTGKIEAIVYGEATIRITSASNSEVMIEVIVSVFKYTEEIVIEGNNIIFTDMIGQLSINTSPAGALAEVVWESSNTDVATIDETGVITGVSIGTTTITAISVLDNEIADTYEIEVINILVVDSSKQVGDTYNYLGVELTHGDRLFSDINTALDNSVSGTTIYISEGSYSEDITLDVEGVTLEGLSNVTFEGSMDVNENNITIRNIIFTGVSNIVNSIVVNNFVFLENNVDSIVLAGESFIELYGVSNIFIENNVFSNINVDAIQIDNFISGTFLIKNNTIDNALNGISFNAFDEYDITTEINIVRNSISNTGVGISIDLMYGSSQKQIEAYARFNVLSNYTIGASSNVGNEVDFTLNYWGSDVMDYGKFVNVEEVMLRGFYALESDIVDELFYNHELPVLIIITNPINEITIGETHTIEYDILPLDLDTDLIKFITGSPEILAINQDGELTPLKSGTCIITVRSSVNSSINTTITIDVITLPGIELNPSNIINNNYVGESFSLNASVFPISISGDAVSFNSSNIEVATIDASGVVTTTGEGVVTFTASLVSDPTVYQTFTMNVYGVLDENNLLDYLTMNQVSYSTPHSWIAYGFAFNYDDTRYESVSRYYFDNVVINDTKIVPVSYGIRPGEPMEPLPVGVTQYNDENIYWVVVHDTASTASGSGALAHANYLYNNALAGTTLWVSWHYTIDDTYIYQSLPEDERGYHAGDGSSQPLQSVTYFGGGNRNGIGIEMAVNQDGDMYRTWQRTAKLVVDILNRNNLPLENQTYHNDFSGKDCPNTLRNAGLIPLFEIFLDVEFKVQMEHPDATITFVSNNPEYLDNHGRIIEMPDEAVTVSYTITVVENGITESRTFYTYLPGTIH